MNTTAKKKSKENRNRNRNRKKNEVNDTPNVLTFTRVSARPGRPVPSSMRQRKKEKKTEKKGEEDIQGDWLHATGSSMLVVSLWFEEGGRPCVEIVGGTWVGDARDVGAGGIVVVKTL